VHDDVPVMWGHCCVVLLALRCQRVMKGDGTEKRCGAVRTPEADCGQ
jgi:hypothetical protein